MSERAPRAPKRPRVKEGGKARREHDTLRDTTTVRDVGASAASDTIREATREAVAEVDLDKKGLGFLRDGDVDRFYTLRLENPAWNPQFPGTDLFGARLSRARLSRADLSGARLSRANLYQADLFGARLSRANLSGANLSGANLSGANLSGADLSDAIISAQQLAKAVFHGAKIDPKLAEETLKLLKESLNLNKPEL